MKAPEENFTFFDALEDYLKTKSFEKTDYLLKTQIDSLADKNIKHQTPLEQAVEQNHWKWVEHTISCITSFPYDDPYHLGAVLFQAIMKNNNAFNFLLNIKNISTKWATRSSGNRIFHCAVENHNCVINDESIDNRSLIKKLLELDKEFMQHNNYSESPLYLAAKLNHWDLVEIMLKEAKNYDTKKAQFPETLELAILALIEDPIEPMPAIEILMKKVEKIPLELITKNHLWKLMELITLEKIDLPAINVAIIHTIQAGNYYMLKRILKNPKANYNYNQSDPERGNAALFEAIAIKRSDLITLLIDNKANPKIKDQYGYTSFDHAYKRGGFPLVFALQKPRPENETFEKLIQKNVSAYTMPEYFAKTLNNFSKDTIAEIEFLNEILKNTQNLEPVQKEEINYLLKTLGSLYHNFKAPIDKEYIETLNHNPVKKLILDWDQFREMFIAYQNDFCQWTDYLLSEIAKPNQWKVNIGMVDFPIWQSGLPNTMVTLKDLIQKNQAYLKGDRPSHALKPMQAILKLFRNIKPSDRRHEDTQAFYMEQQTAIEHFRLNTQKIEESYYIIVPKEENFAWRETPPVATSSIITGSFFPSIYPSLDYPETSPELDTYNFNQIFPSVPAKIQIKPQNPPLPNPLPQGGEGTLQSRLRLLA